MNMLDGIQNFLQMLNDNWTTLVIIVALLFSIIRKIVSLFKKSDDEKISVAKKQIQETMLRLVTDAECDYEEWVKAGSIKRSQVIEEIFDKYPILSKVTNQEELIAWIDDVINQALKTLREVIAEQNTTEVSK